MLRRKEMTTIIIIVSINNYMYIKKRIWKSWHQLSNLEEGEFYDQEAQKKFRSLGENWTLDPLMILWPLNKSYWRLYKASRVEI